MIPFFFVLVAAIAVVVAVADRRDRRRPTRAARYAAVTSQLRRRQLDEVCRRDGVRGRG